MSVDEVGAAIDAGLIGERLWMYSNYHCNLECTYCLTESSPRSPRRMLSASAMLALTDQAARLGFRSIGITGGEPFLVSSMPDTVEAIATRLPVIVLTNATLLRGRLFERVRAWADRPITLQVSLDAPEAAPNDDARGSGAFQAVAAVVPGLVEAGVRVRIASTAVGGVIDGDGGGRLCALHRSWGIGDDDHVVRPVVAVGRATRDQGAVPVTMTDLAAELCVTADGAFWSPFGPSVTGGRLDTTLRISEVIDPLDVAAHELVRIASTLPKGADTVRGIR